MITFLQLLAFIIGVESSANGNCTEFNLSLGRDKWFCCDNHEEVNNTCIKCPDGYESLDGSPCSPCPYGYHGNECAFECNCNATQLCDHLTGCINKQGHKVTQDLSASTVTVLYTSTSTENDVTWFTTFSPPTFKSITFKKRVSSIWITSSRITSTTTKPKENNTGFSSREIIVYSICAGGFACVIIICTVCQGRYKKMYGNLKRFRTKKKRRRNIPEVSIPAIPLEASEGIYEIIDESNMIDNFESSRKRRSLVSDTDESYCEPNRNDYLTPYQPVDEDLNTNDLDDNKSVSDELTGANGQVTDDGESTSSNSVVQGERSSYLNPYQPIVHSVDIHEYSSTHSMNESGTSGSESITLESSYLNPYQPMVPDLDLHDYRYFLECSDESASVILDGCTKEIVAHSYQDLKSKIDTNEYKSVNSLSTDTISTNIEMTKDDSSAKFQIEKEEEYLQME